MRQTLLLFFVAAGLIGCEALGLKDEKFYHQVTEVNKDDYFIIENRKQPTFVFFTIEGDLSHDAKILWSDTVPSADTVFAGANEILLPKGKVSKANVRGDYYSNKLYVKYISLNDSTSGNLQIRIKM
ncbi:hypothetical protein [Dyadobacter sp. CY343]|uniref:hypothetical protein n=1 Tax=Dyadobacter sp. CY343 TaxID=2907299 RepID=UPI001F3E0A8F|nr:hypothetical protein [Dyadobacter sp. CY343]MCE7061962.1 hypothetical protein [Dyadobacter sp. CY343]